MRDDKAKKIGSAIIKKVIYSLNLKTIPKIIEKEIWLQNKLEEYPLCILIFFNFKILLKLKSN